MDQQEAMDRLWNRLGLLDEDLAIARFGADRAQTLAIDEFVSQKRAFMARMWPKEGSE